MTGTKKNQISGKNVIVPATGDVHFLIQLTWYVLYLFSFVPRSTWYVTPVTTLVIG